MGADGAENVVGGGCDGGDISVHKPHCAPGWSVAADQASVGRAHLYARLLIIVCYGGGGFVVCCTYVWGFLVLEDPLADLWGTLRSKPANRWLMRVGQASMCLATIGFFPCFAYALRIAPILRIKTLYIICGLYACFYVSSCFWMPLCVAYKIFEQHSIFVLVCVNLAVSGAFVAAWAFFVCFKVTAAESAAASRALRISGRAGTILFAAHCAVFDAMVWPAFFK